MIKPVTWFKLGLLVSSLGLVLLACQPVMTVGWTEIFILLALIAFLFGPLLFRLFTWYQKYKRDHRSKDQHKK